MGSGPAPRWLQSLGGPGPRSLTRLLAATEAPKPTLPLLFTSPWSVPTSRLILNPNLLPSLLSPRSLPWLIPTPQAPPNCRAGPFGPKACIRDRDRRAGAMTVIGGGVEGQKAEGKCGQLIPGPRVPEKPSGLSRPRGRGTVCPVCVGLAPSMCSGNTV